ncbi:MAG: redox-regulated ATPase YchF [candidate division KSB1 bacterium]|nr:redox-regulated ATPase YchF [candidate division KSB1 bacterium]
MKIGIVGLGQSGKTTLFNALTGSAAQTGFASGKAEANKANVQVPDERVETLTEIYQPEKKVPAVIEYIDLAGLTASEQKKGGLTDEFLGNLRTVDAVLILTRAFHNDSVPHPLNSIDPKRDFDLIQSDLLLSDLNVIENRMQRLEKQIKAKKTAEDQREYDLLQSFSEALENETPLRDLEISREQEMMIRGYQFLTLKPLIVALNIGEEEIPDSETIPEAFEELFKAEQSTVVLISAQIEMEIQQLSDEEAEAFRRDIGITHSAMQRLIRLSYEFLGLISFFTVGSDEVRAWTIPLNTAAPQAAGAIHTDFERGFIRAEVVSYDEFIQRKSLQKCKTDGVLRLEGKDYIVKDGDIISFRFAV